MSGDEEDVYSRCTSEIEREEDVEQDGARCGEQRSDWALGYPILSHALDLRLSVLQACQSFYPSPVNPTLNSLSCWRLVQEVFALASESTHCRPLQTFKSRTDDESLGLYRRLELI